MITIPRIINYHDPTLTPAREIECRNDLPIDVRSVGTTSQLMKQASRFCFENSNEGALKSENVSKVPKNALKDHIK
jgi:hypothetical protein